MARDIAILLLAVLAIYIAYRDYLKTDVRLAITSPTTGSVVLNKEISIEGTASGGPYNGYVVHHKAPGDEERQEVRAVQEDGEQMSAPVFPIPLSLTDESGAPVIGRHTVTVTLKAGGRNVQQDSVAFDVIDCSLVVPWEFILDKPIHDPVDLQPDEQIPGYGFLHYVDGTPWSLDSLDPAYLEDGYHDLRTVAVVRGSEEEVDSVTTNFVVDNTPPIIGSLGLCDGTRVSGRSVLVPTILDPHLARLELCVDSTLVGVLGGKALEQRLVNADLGFTLTGGWQEGADTDLLDPVRAEEADQDWLTDGWHDVLIRACDINGLCSTEAVTVYVDSTPPRLRWDLPSDTAIPLLPSEGFWLGADTPDPEAEIVYFVKDPAAVASGGFLDTSKCELGSEHAVLATAIDPAGNDETQIARFIVERNAQAWSNTTLRAVHHGISSAMAPVSGLLGELAAEGLSLGIGAEVSSSLADESEVMWRGVFDFVVVEVCPVLGRGINGNTTLGVAFRVPLEHAGLATPEVATSLIRSVFDFGAAVTANWNVLNSLGFGIERVAETWVKLSLSTRIVIPLSTEGDEALKLEVGQGCKLSYVQEFVREAVYVDGVIVGVRRFTQDSMKLEVTIDGSIAFTARRQH